MFKITLLIFALWSTIGLSNTRVVNADQIQSADTTKVYTLPSSTDTIVGLSTIAPATSTISASAIDWALLKYKGGLYTKTLGANTTFTFSNQVAGQVIIIRLTNTASNYTVTWPTVKWPGGVTPVMTIGAKSDIYTFIYDGTDIFGTVVQNF